MANIFLTSSLQTVAKNLVKHINHDAKKFLFIITASEVEEGAEEWLSLDRNSMIELGYELEDYTVTGKTKDEIESKLNQVDGVVMAGGITLYLLQQLQLSDSIQSFRNFVKSGKCFIGSSAGSIVAGPDVYAAREPGELELAPKIQGFNGLNITDIVVQPHWGSDSFRDYYLKEIMINSYTPDYKMILLSDNQYVIVGEDNIKLIDTHKD